MRGFATIGLVGLLACGRGVVAAPPESSSPGPPMAAARMTNVRQVRERLGLDPEYASVAGIESIKVAVLDYGFEGVGERPYLPADTVVVEDYDEDFVRRHADLGDPGYRKPFEPGNRHGREMAQIVWGVTGSHPRGPKFFLLNASGPTLLRGRALRHRAGCGHHPLQRLVRGGGQRRRPGAGQPDRR